MSSEMAREFFLGFIKIHVLYHASKESFYGADMMQELGRHGYRIGPGTLYPTLHRLVKSGYLQQEKKVVDGRMRIYYSATRKGRSSLKDAEEKIRELVSEVLEEG